jgi:hypothetical protein
MCIKCAMGLSNEAAKKQLEYVVEKKIFDKINTTGAAFILYACVGIFGNNTKQVGLELIKMFIEWLKNKEYPYLPDNDFEEMYHYKMLIDVVEWCENSNFEIINEDGNEDENESKRVELFNLLNRKMYDLMNVNVSVQK